MENPRLLKTPFCVTGMKNNIPDDVSQVPANKPELASIEGGFPAITMQPKKAGGLPPHGMDFNGIFNLFSQHVFFLSQGGRYKFDDEFAEAINGYSKGTILQGDGDDTNEYISTINNNKINFNTTPSSIGHEWVQYNASVDEDALKRLFIGYESSVPATKQPSEIIYAPIYGLMKWDTALNHYVPDGIYSRMDSLVGIPFPYPLANAPDGWVSVDGAAINATTNPILATMYGSNLPDLRGVVIRGWDDGRGLDTGRALLSYQEDAQQAWTGSFTANSIGAVSSGGVVSRNPGSDSQAWTGNAATRFTYTINNALVARTAIENRMKNFSYHYITPAG